MAEPNRTHALLINFKFKMSKTNLTDLAVISKRVFVLFCLFVSLVVLYCFVLNILICKQNKAIMLTIKLNTAKFRDCNQNYALLQLAKLMQM